MTFTPSVLTAIREQAHGLSPGTSVNAVRFLVALSAVESSGGANNVPRHEAGWCPNQGGGNAKGNHTVALRFSLWGCGACCSWSPWQILYHTAADRGFLGPPWKLMEPGEALPFVIAQLNRIIAGPEPSETLEQLADAWNSGTYRDHIVPDEYLRRMRAAYDAATGLT